MCVCVCVYLYVFCIEFMCTCMYVVCMDFAFSALPRVNTVVRVSEFMRLCVCYFFILGFTACENGCTGERIYAPVCMYVCMYVC